MSMFLVNIFTPSLYPLGTEGWGPSCVLLENMFTSKWQGCFSYMFYLTFPLSNFPHHTQEEMFLYYTKLHSFLLYKFPALSTLQISSYLFFQRDLFLCSLLYHRCSWYPRLPKMSEFWDRRYRRFWTVMYMLEIKPGSSGRAANERP